MLGGLGVTSLAFFVFLAVSCAIYWLIPKEGRWPFLLWVSLVFVCQSTGMASLPFLVGEVLVVYAGAVLMGGARREDHRLVIVAVSIGLVVAQLFVLKYYNNMAASVGNALFKVFGVRMAAWRSTWLAPIGLSYFSLSAIGYLLDVYWKTYEAEPNPFKVALFVSWFPALVSGPFVRFSEQRGELFCEKPFSYERLRFGMQRMLWGLIKKMVIADRVAILTTAVFAKPAEYTGWYMLVAAILFALQIYCDFSGCMDIIVGASEMFQIGLPENFERPFFSQNLSEFWRRWHMTLGLWAKDYVMYPLLRTRPFVVLGKRAKRFLGKKRGKMVPTYFAMLVLWIVIGVWHGGTFKYIFAAGIMPWMMIVGGQLLQPVFLALKRYVGTECFSYRLFSSVRTLLLMCCIWVVAMAGVTTGDGIRALMGMFNLTNPWVLCDGSLLKLGLDVFDFNIVFLGFLALLAVSVLQEGGYAIRASLAKQNLAFQWILLLGGLFVVVVFGIYGPAYNAADFIYAGF